MDLVNGGGAMDALSQHLVQKAAVNARDALVRRGRHVLVVIVAADGPHAAMSHANTALPREHALAYAKALRDKAAEIEASVVSGMLAGA